jgi:subtilisin family serine protease
MKFIAIVGFLVSILVNCGAKKKEDPLMELIKLLFVKNVVDELAFIESRKCNYGTGEDPLYADQWHLNNTGTLPFSVSGEDANVQSVWASKNKGEGIIISVVDDGVEIAHEDLKANISITVAGFNYVTNTTNPSHKFTNSGHGTAVAGVAAAKDLNGIGVRGAAPCANIVGRNILEANSLTGSTQGDAMTKDTDKIHVSNNSWGAPDDTGQLSPANNLWETGITSGLETGRGGKGTIYLWAAGNGGTGNVDNSNYDGQANYYGVLAIGGIGTNGKKARYSEKGANLWLVAHTQGNSDPDTGYTTAITTTDPTGENGYNNSSTSTNYPNKNYSNAFNGTSSATPLAAGVVALLLKAYPDFSWRDIREVLAKSARKNDSTDSDWKTNAAGYNINHKYGFGAIDAAKAIEVGSTWTKITAPQTTKETAESSLTAIPDNNATGVTATINNTDTSITKLEFVDVFFTSNHTEFGDLTITLTSPQSTESVLAEKHSCKTSSGANAKCTYFSSGETTFRFSTARHLGETATGNWSLKVVDGAAGDTGSFKFKLKFYGRN